MHYELNRVLQKIRADIDDNKVEKHENDLITKLQFEELEVLFSLKFYLDLECIC